jgi:hypothetical protein
MLAVGSKRILGGGYTYSPDINEEIGNRLAGVDIYELHFEMHRDTCLSLRHILAQEFSRHVIRTDGVLRRKDAAGIGAEENRRIGVVD